MSAAPALMYRRSPSQGRTVTVRPAAWPAAIVPALVVVRSAVAADAAAIHRLIVNHAAEGRLLPRSLNEIATHIDRFVVASEGHRVIGCADLAPLSSSTAEIRSLVVDSTARATGIGRRLLEALTARATAVGFHTLSAFTHSPAYFVQAGFAIVPHTWVPEKIEQDCRTCSQYRQCGQYAVAMPLGVARPCLVGVGSFNG
jgi:amino-acid N-acetyltransferase